MNDRYVRNKSQPDFPANVLLERILDAGKAIRSDVWVTHPSIAAVSCLNSPVLRRKLHDCVSSHRKAAEAFDLGRCGMEAKTGVRKLLEVTQVLADGDIRSQQHRMHRALTRGRAIDVQLLSSNTASGAVADAERSHATPVDLVPHGTSE